MGNKGFNKIHIICAPFDSITMPSLEVATLKSCLKKNSIQVSVDVLYSEYMLLLGRVLYDKLYSTIIGDAVFSALLFPDNMQNLKNKLSAQINEVDFDEIVQRTRLFCKEYADSLYQSINRDDIVYFHMYTKQFYPSIYLAKLIKQKTGAHIWLGGYHCKGECGQSLLKMFPYIEHVFGEDIEYNIMKEIQNPNAQIYNELNEFPTPDYSDFQKAVLKIPDDLKKEYVSHFWLQVEFSRGCWWNKCSFCSLNCQHSHFQHKSIDNIIRDYEVLQQTYSSTQMLVTEYNSDDNWREMVSALNKQFPGLKGTYYLLFKASELLNEEDYIFIKENDIDILFGVESLSKNNLKMINKGQTVIESIQAIKYAERHKVKCCYNLMCLLPFESEDDLDETSRVISYITHLIPPFDLEVFRLTYSSAIQKNPKRYGIKRMGIRKDIEGVLIPKDLQSSYVPFFMEFESHDSELKSREVKWRNLIDNWLKKYYGYAKRGRPKLHSLLYMRSNDHVLDIFDARYSQEYHVYTLSGIERNIYEFCNRIRSIDEIKKNCSNYPPSKVEQILHDFVKNKIMFKEDANYLSLAI